MKVAIGSCALLLALTIAHASCHGQQDVTENNTSNIESPIQAQPSAAAPAAPAASATKPKEQIAEPKKAISLGGSAQMQYHHEPMPNTVPIQVDPNSGGQITDGMYQGDNYQSTPFPASPYQNTPNQVSQTDHTGNQNPQDAPVTQATLDAKIAALEERLSDLITKSLTNCKMEISSQTASALGNLVEGNQVDSNVAVKLAGKTPVKTPNTADEPTVAKRLYLTVVPKKVAINSYKTVVVNMTRTEMTRVCIDGRVEYQTREVETPIEVCVPCKVDVIVDEPVYKELGVAIK